LTREAIVTADGFPNFATSIDDPSAQAEFFDRQSYSLPAASKETDVLTSFTQRIDPMTTVTTKDRDQLYKDSRPRSARHHDCPLNSDNRENQKLIFGGAS
jgi:hypothetical protein